MPHDIASDSRSSCPPEETTDESAELLRATYERAPIGIAVLDPNTGRFVRVNETYCRATGHSRHDLLGGLTLADVTPAEDLAAEAERRRQLMAGEIEEYRIEKRYLRGDGMTAWCDVSVSLLRDAGGRPQREIRSAQDITERRRAEQALRESDKRLQLALDAGQIGTFGIDLRTGALEADERARALWGVPAEQRLSVGDALSGIHPDDRERLRAAMATSRVPGQKGPDEIEYRVINAVDGAVRYILARRRVEFEDGVAVRTIGTVLDVTAQRRATEVLARDKAELERLVDEGAAALLRAGEECDGLKARVRRTERLDALGKLTGGVAHDFNNLLTAVIGGAEEILDGAPEGHPMHEPAEAVLLAADRGAALTKQLLAFAREQPVRLREVSVAEALREMEGVLRRAVGASAELRFRSSGGPDAVLVNADLVQLETAVLNLVVNARDALPGAGRITVSTTMVRLDEPRAEVEPGDYACIAVEDTGGGMEPEVLARACEPFFTTKAEGQGTGLGLSMVYGFARQSGGALEIESKVGRGTTVRILLPRCAPRAENVTDRQARPPRGAGQRVLLVEDDPLVRKQAEEQVRALGYEVDAAADGPTALAALRADPAAFDVMLTDLVMPGGLSGWALAEATRRLRPGLPVVLCTGYSDEVLRHEFTGWDSEPDWPVLRKPYRRAELARVLHDATGAA
ncbi:PAS domain S-box protein [Roseomonas sp. CCTCC AB2023176]|uniref:PAS domain S-box protein n=1 Tax=Roseomonas sp. CCTCC AB2023176 TaxID=3342640 RepID=UPI0035DE22AB